MQRLAAFCLLATAASAQTSTYQKFPWPGGKRVAVSFSFDDARASHTAVGLDLFARHKARVTFYVNPRAVEKDLPGWRRAVSLGHEIGNHSLTHPCSGNFAFARANNLEDFTLPRLEEDFATAARDIERLLGAKPVTFAYPCGSKFVGRGTRTQSYVPLIAARYLAGRGFRDEAPNDPAFVDLAQTLGIDSDGLSFEQMRDLVKKAEANGGWLVFAGHNIGNPAFQTTNASALDAFLAYAADPASGIWLDTIQRVASHILAHRPPR